jgi:phenylalanyl-tRNA synthetase beta subunit
MSKRDKFYEQFGSGFNPNAERRGGVMCSINDHSVRREETPTDKEASERAVAILKRLVEEGKIPASMLLVNKPK